ncbi:uncharacterized protein AB675_5475 [Cyphellophora attinorum]|uniref:Uncharacterized protein n=1 Tax=Cyphellophora attinorum TaxID=1664694 RepID=A0A0N1P299_9EURO|nr:uncharacterized protein AB675_5475 [Phialophora attinorum]KPI42036.1 hypothetical protein AB675_5475 [Phialophora attinorum]
MAMSAIHRNEVFEQFLAHSLHHLQQDLFNQDDSVLQTIKTLCISEIYSGRCDSAWRIHVAGAAAMVGARTGIIKQWYQSMEALTALTSRGPLNNDEIHPIVVKEAILDLYSGYTPDLNDVFRQIGKGHATADTVYEMIQRDQMELRFPPDVQLDKAEVRQYAACNTAYQHCALIHIYRKLENYDATSPEVQYCVRTILDTVCGILPMNALSPWALLTTPIFTAGCEAAGDDRDLVRTLLKDLHSTLRIKNILRALDILEHQWSSKHAEIESLDFIPY